MKEIILSKGQSTIVDDDDYEYLNQWKWYLDSHGYATRCYIENKKYYRLFMARVILNCQKGLCVDHINGNPLDNRKENLRICSKTGNNRNRKPRPHSSSYKGVIKYKQKNGFIYGVQIRVNNKSIWLGAFKDEKDAAIAYDKAALEYFGEFAYLNILTHSK